MLLYALSTKCLSVETGWLLLMFIHRWFNEGKRKCTKPLIDTAVMLVTCQEKKACEISRYGL